MISCIHYRLSKDPVFAACADQNGVIIWETKEPPVLELNKARVLELDAFVIHTCGSDSNIGKKTTALQIVEEANARSIRTGFAGTGQSGMMITGHGIAIDGVPSDFVASAVVFGGPSWGLWMIFSLSAVGMMFVVTSARYLRVSY